MAGREKLAAARHQAGHRAGLADDRRDPFEVDAVLGRDDHAVGGELRLDELDEPACVVGFAGDEDDVEGIVDRADLVDVDGLHRHDEIVLGIILGADGDTKAVGPHRLDVLGPLIDQRHVMAGACEQAAERAADASGRKDGDPVSHRLRLRSSRQRRSPRC
jgi:hypothetical protein